jgi:hypothetical protein
MKQICYSLILFSILLLLPVLLYAQADTLLPDYSHSGKYLNDQIFADTLANGTHSPTRVYVLSRNGVYQVNGNINNNGWTLRMRAAYGSGYRPTIFLVVPSGQTMVPFQMILAGGKVYLTNLQVSGYNEGAASPDPYTMANSGNNATPGCIINNNTVSNTIVVDSCIISNTVRAHMWMNISASIIKVTHSLFTNSGFIGGNDIGNGRSIDLRNGACDTLIVQNNTFVNMQDRLIRHYSSQAAIGYFLFDHNTVVNNMSYHGFLSFGKMNATGGSKGIITNNLLLDPFALGNDTDAVREVEFKDNAIYSADGNPKMFWVSAEPNDTTQWTVKKNYYGISTAGQAFYTANASAGVTGEGNPLPWHINTHIGIDSQTAFVKVPLTMTKVPAVMTALMNWYRSPTGGNKTKGRTGFTLANDYNRIGYVYLTDTLNCNFKCNTNLTAAALDGKVIGDTRWSWTGAVGVENVATQVPAKFSLDQNYPNPFNPSTNFTYSVAKTGLVSLKVYDLLGREVATLVNEVKEAGHYPIEWNAAGFGSGIYFCKMQSGSFTATKKMILMK